VKGEEREILEAVIGRIAAAGPAAAAAASRAEALLARADESARKDFSRVLRLVDSPAVGFFLTGVPRRFCRVSPRAQDARLRALARSFLPVLRTAYVALQRTSMASVYSDPTSYPGIGYPGPPRRRTGENRGG
jgi:hypothetical protein